MASLINKNRTCLLQMSGHMDFAERGIARSQLIICHIARHAHRDGHTHTHHLIDPRTRLHLPWEAMRPVPSLAEGSRMPKGKELFKLCETHKTPLPTPDFVQIEGLLEPHGGTNATNEVVEVSMELLRAALAKGERYCKPVVRNLSLERPTSKVTGPVGANTASSATFKLSELASVLGAQTSWWIEAGNQTVACPKGWDGLDMKPTTAQQTGS
ncbi:hypothetical protein BS47DRAFT_1401393 [Hydnum rufescens UP504]|uniref:Uncharacterized protein n=1 Tax=Hydnum rufescens UP504 TaxID=1448309 RepID=A0A9P6AEL4_9AGAM|nr:hypothetical protein BS47DRAFT_1401393 [Hydnum rufescens UP504]